jgi:hypothetical protein
MEREYIVNTPGTFLHGTDVPFNLWYVFIIGDPVEDDLEIDQVGAERFGLTIYQHVVDLELAPHIDAFDLLDMAARIVLFCWFINISAVPNLTC